MKLAAPVLGSGRNAAEEFRIFPAAQSRCNFLKIEMGGGVPQLCITGI
jgi:hypothetical protein